MRINRPFVEYWPQGDDYDSHVARCARVCYASNGTTSYKLVWNLRDSGHLSMFRHVGRYYVIPEARVRIPAEIRAYVNIVKGPNTAWYVSTNGQVADKYFEKYRDYEISWHEARRDKTFFDNKMIYYTFVVNTGIDITRELNRKSPNAIAEQSTRYVDFNKKVGIQFKKCEWMNLANWYKKILYKSMCWLDAAFYHISRSPYGLNLTPEDARWCLFLDSWTRAVYTYTVKDWEYIINLRLFDYTGRAHPDVHPIMNEIKTYLENNQYKIINYKNK